MLGGQDIRAGARRAGRGAARRSSTRPGRRAGRPTRRPTAPARSNERPPGPPAAPRSPPSGPDGPARCAAARCPTCCSLPATLFLCVFFLYPFVLRRGRGVHPRRRLTARQLPQHGGALEVRRRFRNTLLLAAWSCRSSSPWRSPWRSIVTRARAPGAAPSSTSSPSRSASPTSRPGWSGSRSSSSRAFSTRALYGLGVIERAGPVPQLPEPGGASSSPSRSPRSGARPRS